MTKVLKVNRSQLAKFLPDHATIKEFEQLFSNENELIILIENIIIGTGLESDGLYAARVGSNYLDASENIFEDSTILDGIVTRDYVIATDTSISLSSVTQTVICDATTGPINITLPPPSECFSSNRSFRFAIHKIDTSSNEVTILPNVSELVVGEESQSLLRDGEIYNFITDGTRWYLGA